MELWSCIVYDFKSGEKVLLGIFSDKEKAKTQAHVFMQGVGDIFELVDHADEAEADETLYYKTKHTDERYTVYIERYHLNELSY